MPRIEQVIVLGVAALPWLVGCGREIPLGDLVAVDVGRSGAAPVESSGGTEGSTGGSSDGSDASGEGGARPASGLVFSSGFETGDLSEWGPTASSVALEGGELSVLPGSAHGGTSALRVTTNLTDEYIGVAVSADYPRFAFGFWMRLEQSFDSGSWVILNVDERFEGEPVTVNELFDLAIQSVGGAEPRLFVWEKPTLNDSEDGQTLAEASAPLPLGQWVHVEMEVHVATDAAGSLAVTQDGDASMDLPALRTSTGGTMRLSLGSFAHQIEPLPLELWFDDVTLRSLDP